MLPKNLQDNIQKWVENNGGAGVVAQKSGVPRSTVRNWVRTDKPRSAPQVDQLHQVAVAYHTTVDVILYGRSSGVATDENQPCRECEIKEARIAELHTVIKLKRCAERDEEEKEVPARPRKKPDAGHR